MVASDILKHVRELEKNFEHYDTYIEKSDEDTINKLKSIFMKPRPSQVPKQPQAVNPPVQPETPAAQPQAAPSASVQEAPQPSIKPEPELKPQVSEALPKTEDVQAPNVATTPAPPVEPKAPEAPKISPESEAWINTTMQSKLSQLKDARFTGKGEGYFSISGTEDGKVRTYSVYRVPEQLYPFLDSSSPTAKPVVNSISKMWRTGFDKGGEREEPSESFRETLLIAAKGLETNEPSQFLAHVRELGDNILAQNPSAELGFIPELKASIMKHTLATPEMKKGFADEMTKLTRPGPNGEFPLSNDDIDLAKAATETLLGKGTYGQPETPGKIKEMIMPYIPKLVDEINRAVASEIEASKYPAGYPEKESMSVMSYRIGQHLRDTLLKDGIGDSWATLRKKNPEELKKRVAAAVLSKMVVNRYGNSFTFGLAPSTSMKSEESAKYTSPGEKFSRNELGEDNDRRLVAKSRALLSKKREMKKFLPLLAAQAVAQGAQDVMESGKKLVENVANEAEQAGEEQNAKAPAEPKEPKKIPGIEPEIEKAWNEFNQKDLEGKSIYVDPKETKKYLENQAKKKTANPTPSSITREYKDEPTNTKLF